MPMKLFVKICMIVLLGISWSTFSASHSEALSCTATISSPINFGTVDTLGSTATTTQGLLTMTCSVTALDLGNLLLGIAVCPGVGDGSGGATTGTRLLTGPGGSLQYQIYSDANRQVPWGGYTGGLLFGDAPLFRMTAQVGTVTQSWPIYASVPGQQNLTPGQYISAFSGAAGTQIRYGSLGSLLGCSSLGATLSTSANFTVQATVSPKCNILAPNNINFGTHGLLKDNVVAQGAVHLSCTQTTNYSVALETGGVSPTARLMKNGNNSVVYGLYKDSQHLQPWGDASGQTHSAAGTGTSTLIPVYGRVLPQATPPAGVYTDTVIIRITY
ncbi:spore coat U domain-containing protein [Brucella sp. TWI432]